MVGTQDWCLKMQVCNVQLRVGGFRVKGLQDKNSGAQVETTGFLFKRYHGATDHYQNALEQICSITGHQILQLKP